MRIHLHQPRRGRGPLRLHSNLVVAQELALLVLAVLVVGLKQLRPDFLVPVSYTHLTLPTTKQV